MKPARGGGGELEIEKFAGLQILELIIRIALLGQIESLFDESRGA